MITDGRGFNTNLLFSGGAGMFLQYHDIVKPAYLYAIIKMLLTKSYFGLPLDIIKDLSVFSLIEWYLKRRYKNPLRSLDFMHKLNPKELDDLLLNILNQDDSIYKLSPSLVVKRLLSSYRKQHMTFPIYIYSENEEIYIDKDCKNLFSGLPVKYLYGDLKESINKCDQNFTYILSDIELVKKLSKILMGTCSHVLLSADYRYNYQDNYMKFKYNLSELSLQHPFIRIGLTQSVNLNDFAMSFKKIMNDGGN